MNGSQTKKQFELLYGDKVKWSKTTKAAYEHLFNNIPRIVAVNEQGITEQTLSAFLRANELKHLKQNEVLIKAKAYKDAADK